MDVNALVSEFADCVAEQSKCIVEARPDEGNEYAKRYIAAFEQLREHGDSGREALVALFDDDRAEVRTMAAAFLLRYAETRAKQVLVKEAKGAGLIAFGAKQALQRWEEGTWDLDPE